MRRLVAGTIAQSITPAVEAATSPFQYATATKSGGRECVAHAIQSLTDLDSRAMILSIDGISAIDLISRAAMLDGLSTVEGGDSVLPFVLQFHSEPSQYLFVVRRLRRHTIAYHNDLHVVCSPERVGPINKIVEDTPPGCCVMQRAAEHVDPHARVWRGNGLPKEQGVRVLGIPIGHVDFVKAQLRATTAKHSTRFKRVQSLKICRALGSCSCSVPTHATYSLWGVPPTDVSEFAAAHDAATWRCCMGLLGLPPSTDRQDVASLLRFGRMRFVVCHEVACVCPLGQLGGQHEDDSSPASRSGGNHDHTSVRTQRLSALLRRLNLQRGAPCCGLCSTRLEVTRHSSAAETCSSSSGGAGHSRRGLAARCVFGCGKTLPRFFSLASVGQQRARDAAFPGWPFVRSPVHGSASHSLVAVRL